MGQSASLPTTTASKGPPSKASESDVSLGLVRNSVQAAALDCTEQRQPAVKLDAGTGGVVALKLADPLNLDKTRGRKPAQSALPHLEGVDAGANGA